MATDLPAAPEATPRAQRKPTAPPNGAAPPPPPLGPKAKVDAVAALIAGAAPARSDPLEKPDHQGPETAEPEAPDEEQQRHGHDEGDDEQKDVQEGSGGESADDTASLDDVAAAAGLTRAELNAIPVRVGGETLTLGELKAKLPELAKLEASRADFEQQRETIELENIDATRRVYALVDAIPAGSLPPQLMRRLEAQHEETRQREAGLLFKARPQWSDEKYAAAERSAILKLGAKYGLRPAEIGSITDHRRILLLQDFAHTLARLDAAKGQAQRVTTTDAKPLGRETTRAPAPGDSRSSSKGRAPRRSDLAARAAQLIARG